MRSSSSTDNPIVRWIPFEVNRAYVDCASVGFDSVGGPVSIIDIGDVA